jgi:hypothetical protein
MVICNFVAWQMHLFTSFGQFWHARRVIQNSRCAGQSLAYKHCFAPSSLLLNLIHLDQYQDSRHLPCMDVKSEPAICVHALQARKVFELSCWQAQHATPSLPSHIFFAVPLLIPLPGRRRRRWLLLLQSSVNGESWHHFLASPLNSIVISRVNKQQSNFVLRQYVRTPLTSYHLAWWVLWDAWSISP